MDPEKAEKLRRKVARALKITGDVTTEELLDRLRIKYVERLDENVELLKHAGEMEKRLEDYRLSNVSILEENLRLLKEMRAMEDYMQMIRSVSFCVGEKEEYDNKIAVIPDPSIRAVN